MVAMPVVLMTGKFKKEVRQISYDGSIKNAYRATTWYGKRTEVLYVAQDSH